MRNKKANLPKSSFHVRNLHRRQKSREQVKCGQGRSRGLFSLALAFPFRARTASGGNEKVGQREQFQV